MNYHVSRWRLGSGSQASEGGGARGWGDDREVSRGDPLGQEAPFFYLFLFLSFLWLSDSPFCSPFLTLFFHVFSEKCEKGEKCEKKMNKKGEKRVNRKARERKAS